MPTFARFLVAASCALLIAGCGDIARLVTPGSTANATPARVAFSASIAKSVSTATDVVTLRVVASYLRKDASHVTIGSQSLPLGSAETQSVPIPVDVAACLADPLRDVGASDNSCPVVLNIALLLNGIVVDEQVIGPLRLTPGATTSVADPVTLFDIASIDVSVSDGPVLAPGAQVPAVLGQVVTLAAKVKDTRNATVANRNVTWLSDAPSVATIGASSGVITTVGVGVARMTATTGNVSTSVALTVARPPAALTISSSSSSGAGVVRSTPAGIDCRVAGAVVSGTCAFTFPGDAAVTLTSVADVGSLFTIWGDACVGASVGTSCQVVMSRAQQASAVFTAMRRVIVSTGTGDGRGRVTGPQGLDCRLNGPSLSGTCAVDVADGTGVVLTAATEPGVTGAASRQVFGGWSGDCTGTAASCAVSTSGAGRTVTAAFFDEKTLSITLAGSGAGRVTSAEGIDCLRANNASSGMCAQAALYGSVMTLSAGTTDAQSVFGGWGGACASASGNTCTTTLTQARAATATFNKRQVALTMNLSGSGGGNVLVDGGSACVLATGQNATTCVLLFDVGARITIGWSTTSASQFGGFAGDCSGTSTCTLDMTTARSLNASFSRRQVTLTLSLSGAGAGSVLVNGANACTLTLGQNSATCSQLVDIGRVVSVSGTPADGATFGGLGGDCPGADPCTLTMSTSRSVSASFTRAQVAVTVNLTGLGAGQVQLGSSTTCSLALLQGNATCTRLVDVGTTFTIGASPLPGSVFAGFGTPCAPGVSSCTFVVTAPLSISATFNRSKVPLTIRIGGGGSGTVFANGLSCPGDTSQQGIVTCTQQVDIGTAVVVSASPNSGSLFNGFGGDCASTTSCSFTMLAAASVSVTFVPASLPVSVSISGNGRGSVSVGGTTCAYDPAVGAPACTRQVAFGSSITISATPGPGTVIAAFDGQCPSSGNTCTITVTSARTIGLSFTLATSTAPPARDDTERLRER